MNNRRKYVFITGASSGIGKEIAIGLSCDYNLVLIGRNLETLGITRQQCSSLSKVLFFICDLNEIDNVEEKIAEFIVQNGIEIDHFVHSAGFLKMIPLKMLTNDVIKTTLNINLISALVILKVLANKGINGSAFKSAVMISSNISNFGAKAFSIYGASKAGLDSLVRNLATELAPRIRINSVLPGAVKTAMSESIFDNETTVNRMEKDYPLGLGEPKDIFGIVEFLLSEKAKWITGQQFTIDGGRTINISG